MKSTKAAHASIDVSNMSIPDAEEIIEEALGELAYSQDPGLARALQFLAPPGYQVIVELCGENGPSGAWSAGASSWSVKECRVRICFDRIDGDEPAPRSVRSS